ncbi:MAG: zinc ribbon domain-containing protein [Firmicutes bacterium]|nr:zinc ribbon domain-containing protein [Bacillota bacterium]
MPTYEYECSECGRFQYSQRITEPALEACPTCGKPVRRLISRNVGIIFKGPGFYCTDYRSKEEKRRFKEEETGKEAGKETGKEPAPAKTKSSSG